MLRVEPLGVLWVRLGDYSAVVSQNRYFVRYLRVQMICYYFSRRVRVMTNIFKFIYIYRVVLSIYVLISDTYTAYDAIVTASSMQGL